MTVAARAFADHRFARLAQLLGLADADHARGKMLHVWSACTERGTFTLPTWSLVTMLGPKGPDALVEAELAERAKTDGDRVRAGEWYVKGAEAMCEWLVDKRASAAVGGRIRAENARRVAGRFTSDEPATTSVAGPAFTSVEPAPLVNAGDSLDQRLPAATSASAIATAKDLQRRSRTEGESVRGGGEDPASPAPPKVPKASRLPEDWRPREQELEKLRGEGITDPDVLAEYVEGFRSYHRSNGTTRSDWNAALRTWISRDVLRGSLPKAKQQSRPHVVDVARSEQRRLDANEIRRDAQERRASLPQPMAIGPPPVLKPKPIADDADVRFNLLELK